MNSCEPDYTLKLVLIGDQGVGKTSIANRYARDEFQNEYKATVGVDFVIRRINHEKYGSVRLQIWDTAGQERYQAITAAYFRATDGVLVVYDVNDSKGIEGVKKWKNQVNAEAKDQEGNPAPVILLANKCDVNPTEAKVPIAEIKEMNFLETALTSAKTNIGIEESIKKLVTHILDLKESRRNKLLPPPLPPFNLQVQTAPAPSNCAC